MITKSIGQTLARRLKLAEQGIATMHGQFVLFVLTERETAPGKWDLLVSAPWLQTNRTGIQQMVDMLKSYLSSTDWLALASITPLPTSLEYVQWIAQNYKGEQDVQEVTNTFWNDLFITHGYVISANPSPLPATAQPVAA